MDSLKPSFMLLPNFTFLPERDVLLGTIIPQGKESKRPDPRRPLNKSTRIAPGSPSTQILQPWSWDSEKQKGANAGIDADISILTGVGGGIEGEIGVTDGLKITCDRVVVNTFLPDADYIAQAIQNPNIQTLLKKYTRPAVYLVAGIMVAHGANVEVKRGAKRGGKVGASADLTTVGAPINVGAHVGADIEAKSTLATVPGEPFLLAYQLVRIRKKLIGSFEDVDENKWALFSDDDDDRLPKPTKEDWDITQTLSENDLDDPE